MFSQRSRLLLAVAAAIICLAPLTGQAQVAPYEQSFEDLIQTDSAALGNDGWVVYGSVFDPLGNWLYGYGTFPAPNHEFAFSQIDILQGGIDQGLQQLVVFSDYNNTDHAVGNTIESNVFQEQTISAADIGSVWKFSFDAKLGNIEGASTAKAFIKTIDPGNGFAQTNFVFVEMTAIPVEWNRYEVSLSLADPLLEGQYIQFGFLNTATLYEGSGIFYDNIVWELDPLSPVPDASVIAGARLGQNYPNPFNPSTRIDFALEKAGHVDLTVYDVAGRKVRTLHSGSLGTGDHHVTWNGLTDAGLRAASGRYQYVLTTETGQTARSMVLLK